MVSEIRLINQLREVGSLSTIMYEGFHKSQVVGDFWNINSTNLNNALL